MPDLSEGETSIAHSVDFPGCFGKLVDHIAAKYHMLW